MSAAEVTAAATRQVITDLYAALGRRDHAAMAALYAPDARFSDPVFGDLQGAEVTAMWRMLCEGATELEVTLREVTALGERGAATWEARYPFSETGRRVHNIVEAHLTVFDGLIVRHDDHFDLWRWSRQALGPAGLLLGWSPVIRLAIRRRARRRLESFRAAHS